MDASFSRFVPAPDSLGLKDREALGRCPGQDELIPQLICGGCHISVDIVVGVLFLGMLCWFAVTRRFAKKD